MLCMAGAVLMVGAAVLYLHTRAVMPQAPPGSLSSAAAPSSVRPTQTAVSAYTVPPDLPKYISAPDIGIAKSRVVQLGIAKGGVIAAPSNIFDAGWYNGSAKPGQQGAMFIYGHVSSWTANGIFYNLKKLHPGNQVLITRGDGRQFTYRVTSLKTYPSDAVDMSQVLSPVSAGAAGLNLMTCTGTVIKGTSEFSERLVVFTILDGTQ